jgi:hypothetical protein
MRTTHDLGRLSWQLSPFVPWFWQFQPFQLSPFVPEAQVIPARVPGSVQEALLEAGLLPDWNIGQAARACEWVENRHWMYEVSLPDEPGAGGSFILSTGDQCGRDTPDANITAMVEAAERWGRY